ncbi:hypothetical protein [Saccharibacillus sp. JS10]|uniref:hypothetical protein n=1 Tax=Saccharibacillus sp. JS10 TaxID=2950552 RepID=UPI00210DF0CA|nr:hypothetical protein [Saccharibacillus sp. JS10]MCQ4087412.1 hypothetical protein [Saccharibacillus sp. JS10]
MEDRHIQQLFQKEATREEKTRTSVSDAALMRAIRVGVNQGQSVSRKRIYRYGGAGVASLALATGVFIATDGGQNLVRAAIVAAPTPQTQPRVTGKWGEYEIFRPSVTGDQVLRHALDKKEVEPLDVRVEQDGFTLDLYGVVRDSQKLTLLYEISGEDVRSTAISIGVLKNESGKQIGSQEYRKDYFIDGSLYGYATFELDSSETKNLESFKLEAPLYSRTLNPGYDKGSKELAVLEADVKVDPNGSKGELNLAAGQTLTVDGQMLHVEQALITPNRGYIVLVPDEKNTKNISRLVAPKLMITKDGETVEFKSGLGAAGGVIEHLTEDSVRFKFTFNTSLPRNPDSVVFSVDGIEALDREEQKLIVNTETSKVLQAPDDDITVNVSPSSEGYEVAQFHYPIDASRYIENSDWPSTLFLGRTFTDAKGTEYPTSMFMDENGGSETKIFPSSKSTISTYEYKKMDYAQPLTFKILSYNKEVLDHQELKLK